MEQEQLTTFEQDLRQIADMLLLNGTLTYCSGLIHGKMGIVVFFFHYAKYTDNMLFADYAMEVIGEIQSKLHINSPADYEKGLAGIGVGIDFLIQNNFLVAGDDICEDFDDRMYRAVMYEPWQNFSLYDGLTGYGRYWISRLRYQKTSIQARECLCRIIQLIKRNSLCISINEQTDVYCFLYDLQQIPAFESCGGLLKQFQGRDFLIQSFSRLGDTAATCITRMYLQNRYFDCYLQNELDNALKNIRDLDRSIPPIGMGLLNGYAGEGMLRLTALNQISKSWINLL